jgi:hypothetical protein
MMVDVMNNNLDLVTVMKDDLANNKTFSKWNIEKVSNYFFHIELFLITKRQIINFFVKLSINNRLKFTKRLWIEV